MADNDKCSTRDAYSTIINFVIAAEHLRWTRFNNYLVFNTILVLAWSTIYASSKPPEGARFVLALLAVFGFVSGVIWGLIGRRGAINHDAWVKEGQKIELNASQWLGVSKPCDTALKLRDDPSEKLPYGWVGAYHTLKVGPFVFSAVYVLLFGVSLGILEAASAQKLGEKGELAMQILTLVIGAATLVVTALVLRLELRISKEKRRANKVWRIYDECMRIGYKIKKTPSSDLVWQWISGVATFFRLALGYHAQETVLEDVRTRAEVEACTDSQRESLITQAQTRLHQRIADKIVEGRIHPDFRERKWRGWTPEEPQPRELVSFD